ICIFLKFKQAYGIVIGLIQLKVQKKNKTL
ncbi:MAG: hypothetical protein K0S93_758, partial [Nitrososphaeraceae archaeon]|nr:hypothetical protein [Nitrososphaeraceae archaeon]